MATRAAPEPLPRPWPTGRPDMVLDGPASRELGLDRRGLEDPPVGGPLADWVSDIRAMPPSHPVETGNKTALTSILVVLGAEGRDSSPQDRL